MATRKTLTFTRCGIRAQAVWFALGSWIGAFLAILAEARRTTGPARYFFDDDDETRVVRIFLAVPMAIFVGLIFEGWLSLRSRRKGRTEATHWAVPLVAGVIFPPLSRAAVWSFSSLFPPLAILMGVLALGLPLVAAEVCLRRSRDETSVPEEPQNQDHPSSPDRPNQA